MFKRWAAAFACGAALMCAAPAQAREGEFSPALFVVRDADSTMYIFGTMHIRPAGAPWGAANAHAALSEADEVWLEALTSDADGALMLQHGLSAEPLSSRLTPEQNARVAAVLQGLGMPGDAMEMTHPWLAGLMLQVLPLLSRGYDPEAGADSQIEAWARANNRTLRSFETSEQQLRFLADMDVETQIELLMESVESLEEGLAEEFELEQAWARGDLEALELGDIAEMRREYPEFYDVLLTRRNAAWVEVMVEELNGAGVDFIAVGAAHLVGEDGVVEMLRARGYVVERL